MIYTIPLNKVPSQSKAVLIGDQSFVVRIRQLKGRQYLSLSLAGDVICRSVLLVNQSRIARVKYKGMSGDFFVIDTQGDAPPEYTGWGERWQLAFSTDA